MKLKTRYKNTQNIAALPYKEQVSNNASIYWQKQKGLDLE